MRSSDNLWRLVHLLDKAEARYFRLFAQLQSGKKKYEYLYDEVSKVKRLEKYDESLVRERLDSQHKIPAGSFAVTKKYLFDTLLKSLRLLHEDKSIENRIRRLYDDASLLFNRGITDKSLEYTREAKKLAEKYERFAILTDLINLELQHEFLSLKPAHSPFAQFEALYRQKEIALEKLAQEIEAHKLRDQAYVLYRTRNTQQGKAHEQHIQELKNKAFLQQPGKFRSFRSELYYHHAWALIYTVENTNLDLVFYHSQKTLEVWDKYPLFQEEYPRLYKVNLFAYLGTCHLYQRYTGFEATLKAARNLKSRTVLERASDFLDISNYQLLFLLNTNRHEEALKLARKLEEKIADYNRRKYPIRKEKLITLYYNISILLFVTEKYDEALNWIHKNRKVVRKTMTRLDIQYFTRILQLLIFFEKGENDQLDYKEPYVKKLLKNDDMLSAFDETVLSHLRKLNKSVNTGEEREIYQGLLSDIGSSEEKFKKVRGREEVKIWAKSRLGDRKMAEILWEENQAAMAKA